jgi:hypothetical protein
MEESGYLYTPREKGPGTRWKGGCVDPRAGLNAVGILCRESNPNPSDVQPVTVLKWIIASENVGRFNWLQSGFIALKYLV